jgi:uncharacterized protein (TIGR00299 family) protein
MKTLYLDIFSGISGDMFLGAMIDLGVDFAWLQTELARLPLGGFRVEIQRGLRGSIAGTGFKVVLADGSAPEDHPHPHGPHGHSHEHPHGDGHHHHHSDEGHHDHADHDHHQGEHDHEDARNFTDIQHLIEHAPYSDWVKARAVAVFRRIAEAEGRIHGVPAAFVHFHEVGAVDSIVDIVGACLALEKLGRPRVLAGRVVEGTGTIKCAHGTLPLPAPATLEILAARQVPITQCEEPQELVTPTGAALLAEFAESFGPFAGLTPLRTGFGLGGRENRTRPNVLRVLLAEAVETPAEGVATPSSQDWEADVITVLETNLDDVSAEVLGHFLEQAMRQGALDVFHTSIQMKKNRPGILLTVLCESAAADKFTELMLRETSAFGVRRYAAERRKLHREFVTVPTAHGAVRVKVGLLNGHRVQVAPEYESCRVVAAASGVSLRQVFQAALFAAQHPHA